MREISVLIRRVQSGLAITDEESEALRAWIAFRKKGNDKFINAFLMIAIIGLLLIILRTL